MDFIAKFTITENDDSTITIAGDIPFTELEKQRSKSIAHLGKDLNVDGFRKGQIPEKILVEKVGEMRILGEMAERTLSAVYPEIIKEKNIDAIGHPKIQINKLAQGNPLGFTATVAVVPKIELPDYKTIAKEVNATRETSEISETDIDNQIKDILRQKVAYERLQKKASKKQKDGTSQAPEIELPTPESLDAEAPIKDSELPKLTDEYVQTLGEKNQFKNVADFKAKLKEHLVTQKAQDVYSKHRARITDAILKETTLVLPSVLIEAELDQMSAQMEDDLARSNLKMEDYLNHIKKTKEELRKEWTHAAENRAKIQLILNEIAKKEDIKPDAKEMEKQVTQILTQFKEADRARVEIYVASILTNDAVMKMLETS